MPLTITNLNNRQLVYNISDMLLHHDRLHKECDDNYPQQIKPDMRNQLALLGMRLVQCAPALPLHCA